MASPALRDRGRGVACDQYCLVHRSFLVSIFESSIYPGGGAGLGGRAAHGHRRGRGEPRDARPRGLVRALHHICTKDLI